MKPTISIYINLQKHHETEEHENEQPQPHCQMTVDSIACVCHPIFLADRQPQKGHTEITEITEMFVSAHLA